MNLNLGDTRLIIDACKSAGLLRNQAAYVPATAYWETARTMKPVREYGGEGRLKEAKSEVAGQASTAQATATMAREELMAYRTHVAETYVSKQGHREATEQIMEAINAVKTSVDGTNQRIDRMWETQPQKPRRTA
jgi:hypothetical protein